MKLASANPHRSNGFVHRLAERTAVIVMLLAAATLSPPSVGSPWGASYFPNVELTTDAGATVRFFDDLIEGRIVVVNFIYTRCPDVCPLETAQLVSVQNILGDRLGQDVFFFSISIDPERDTPAVLREYKERFGARWTFLTGDSADVTELRKKLGLYITEIQDGSNNHNVSMIIGNQATGRWMKRSPFENPHVLADQIGNWLTDWKAPSQGRDYAQAPALRNISPGEQIFRTRCAACHSLNGHEPDGALGPDLLNVSQRRERQWLLDWLRAPDEMLQSEDPIAVALYERYDRLAMPNMSLNRQEALDLLAFIDEESARLTASIAPSMDLNPAPRSHESSSRSDVVAIMNAWVREAHPKATVNAGYLALVNTRTEAVTVVAVESPQFERVEIHEMAMTDGLMSMQELEAIDVPAESTVQLKPGGKHLMLIEPKMPLIAGQSVAFTLRFASGRRQTLTAPVANR